MAQELRERGVDIVTLAEWRGGEHLDASDDEILFAARRDRRTLVTYDVGTVPSRLRVLIEADETHAGVVLVSAKTIPSNEVGALVRALERLAGDHHPEGLENEVRFLSQ